MGVGTVSRVINGSASVSEATRRRVLDVVAELGYEPNATARALSTGRTRSVGVDRPVLHAPSVIERLRGVAPMLAAAGYQLVLFDVERPEQRAGVVPLGDRPRRRPARRSRSRPPTADQRRLAAAGDPRRARRPRARRAADRHGRRRRGRPDGHEHLLELGHRRIAFAGDTVDGVHGASASSRRCVGYQRALGDAGRAGRARPRQAAPARARGRARSRATCWSWPRRRRRSSPPPTCRRSRCSRRSRRSACGCRTIFR